MGLKGNWDRRGGDSIGRLGSIDRRRFLALSGASAASLVLGTGPFTEKTLAASALSDYPFRLGVASGDPRPDGVVLWTRLAPQPHAADGRGGMPAKRVDVRWEVATDDGFRNVVKRGTTPAQPELGHSVHVEVSGLAPAHRYFYRFKAGSDTSPVGRTATTPERGRAVRELSFGVVSCQHYEHGYYTAYRHMAQEDLDLVFHLGDYIYEYGPHEYTVKSGWARSHDAAEPTDLASYRRRYGLYRSDGDLRRAHAAFPWVVIWDDHEVENNYAGGIPERDQSPEAFVKRRAAAYQAYYEHMPLRRASVPVGPAMRIYRRMAYGGLVQFRMLDARQYRDDQVSRDTPLLRREPDRTLLGADQEGWLLRNFTKYPARWNVLAQPDFFSQLVMGTGTERKLNMDAWDGYWMSRQRVLNALVDRRVSNPVILSGDVHANWANDVLRNFDRPDSKVIAAEFVGTSVTSGGNGGDIREDTKDIHARNPHVRFFNDQRGYMRCHVTPDRWRTDYRVVPYVNRRGAEIYTRASAVVEAGRPGLHVDVGRRVPGAPVVSPQVESDRTRAQASADK